MARYFIDRPIFAWVLAILAMLFGALALRSMPVSQFPEIAPPIIRITATYPGADAETLERTTTQIIEQQLRGIDHLRYFSSNSSSAGQVSITLTFEQGTDADTAQVQVQNKLQAATALLPVEVQRQGIQVTKSAANFALLVAIHSTGGTLDIADLTDLVVSRLQDPVSRIEGVGDVQTFGGQYAMRIWVDPVRLTGFQLTMADVIAAVRAQNAQVSAGQLGAQPAPASQLLNATVSIQSRLQTAEEFGAIRLKTDHSGAVVRLRDVARVELGAEDYSLAVRYNGGPAAAFAIRLAAGANALNTVDAVKHRVEEIARTVPPGVEVVYPYDTTPFVRLSIEQVVHTLIEAVVLVFLVMFLFLQNWRATLIPTIAVPVVLLGTFAVLHVLGYSINTLTLFGMVLAIGLLVDDAIVVVENVERLIQTEGLSPLEAARSSMDQISGALIGIALILASVFVPMAFFGGSTGVIFRQFSVTIVTAMALSVVVALVLTPALAATILKPHDPSRHHSNGPLARFFRWFNAGFDRATIWQQGGVKRTINGVKRSALVYLLILVGVGLLFWRLPTGFLPDEDLGVAIALVQGQAGASTARTDRALAVVSDHFLHAERDNVQSVLTVSGFSFAGQGQNTGLAFVLLKNWDERQAARDRSPAIAARAMGPFSQYRDAMLFAFVPPAVPELGNATGFDLQLVDQAGLGHQALLNARNTMMDMATHDPHIAQLRPVSLEDAPRLAVDVDRDRARALGLDIADVNQTLSAAWGSFYVDDFIDRGRVKRVMVQVDERYRMAPEDISNFFVRGADGGMAPFTAFSSLRWENAPVQLNRYNGLPAFELQGAPAPGVSTGTAMQTVEELRGRLPQGVGLEWTGLSYEEQMSGGQAPALYGLSLLIVFLCLAGLYESWSVPLAVILVVPLGIIGAMLAAYLAGLENNIYLQVGLITTMGLSAKNAILIVEFAEARVRGGMGALDAAIEATRLRLRPIIMTSLAFVCGVLPLALARGAGAGGQNTIGWAVTGGTLSATFLAIFFVPAFFVFVRRLFARRARSTPPAAAAGQAVPQGI